jgi:hypothetical protein
VTDHEHVFIEEREPEGRLILPPCITCGLAAMDALEQTARERDERPLPLGPSSHE